MRYLIPLVLTVLADSSASAQQTSRSHGFLDVRYASHTSLTLYAGYDVGGPVLLAGMVQNPRTEYRELVAGAARPLGGGRVSATIALAGAFATDGWYGQLYLLPSLTLGPVELSGLLLAYAPLEDAGARQFYVNPVSAFLRIAPRLRAGGSYTLATQAGSATRQTTGPALQIAMPDWTATLSVLAGLGDATDELRIGINARM